MTSQEVRDTFLRFFEKRGHAILPSASLVPENDASALFTTAGVQPLVPYILQGTHPKGTKLCSVQKCVRTTDIDDIGDKTHATFFEMLGNWSIGDYFKEEAIAWSYELLTSKEGFGLDPKRLYVTVYAGDSDIPKDTEAIEIWKKVGMPAERIYTRGEDNFWSAGDNGPCGPSTEMFYDLTETGLGDMSPEEFEKADEKQQVVEIWNDVFMQYLKKEGKVVGVLPKKNVDTGSGLERILTILQGKESIFETDVFLPLFEYATTLTASQEYARIVADHLRTAIFMLAEGVRPSNTDRGYVLRRLLRRAVFHTREKRFSAENIHEFVTITSTVYVGQYVELKEQSDDIAQEIEKEVVKFSATLSKGLKQFEKYTGDISGKDAFFLFTTYGFPIEMTVDLAKKKGVAVNIDDFRKELEAHQEKSRSASIGKFKGGLGGDSDKITRLHTAHHLVLAGLQKLFGKSVKQRGSNITEERLRIDFSFDRKLTEEERKYIEDFVNDAIEKDLRVVCREMPKEQAEKLGAEMEFGAKYGDIVSVYSIEDSDGNIYSREFCGGPHAESTGLLGTFKIKKEESSSAGVRRIKGVLL